MSCYSTWQLWEPSQKHNNLYTDVLVRTLHDLLHPREDQQDMLLVKSISIGAQKCICFSADFCCWLCNWTSWVFAFGYLTNQLPAVMTSLFFPQSCASLGLGWWCSSSAGYYPSSEPNIMDTPTGNHFPLHVVVKLVLMKECNQDVVSGVTPRKRER